jgi:serine/threonine protein kinase
MSELLGNFEENYDDKCEKEESNFSKIYTAHNKLSDKYVILKIIDKKKLELGDYDYLLSQIEREEEITKLCRSQYTIELYQKLENENAIIFEFEEYENNLMEYISKKGSFCDDIESFKNIIKNIAEALKIMYNQGYMHRDIKPSKIFLLDEENLNSVKLGGFGCSIKIKENKNEPIGNIVYSAPEIIKNIKYNEKCDLWSLGVTLYELYYNYTPYGINVDENTIIYKIYEPEKFIYRMSGNPCLDILFKRLLQINPNDRMTYKEFFEYVLNDNFMTKDEPYIKKYKDLYNEIKDLISKQKDDNEIHNEAYELSITDEEYINNKMKSITKKINLFDINNCTYVLSGKEKNNKSYIMMKIYLT